MKTLQLTQGRKWTPRASLLAWFLMPNVMAAPLANDAGTLTGDFTTVVGTGLGLRVKDIDNSPEFANSGLASTGDKNYEKGKLFSLYVKAIPELSLAMPEQGLSFLARGIVSYDPGADRTNTPLPRDSREQLVSYKKLLDLWVSKSFDIDGHTGRLRVGNQVINWGETLYASGGINATNAYDFQKFNIPGTLLKEVLQPAPIISLAGGVAEGWRMEAYYQVLWNSNIFAPVGGYFSTGDGFGKGSGWNQIKAKNSGQFGVSAHYKPAGSSSDYGFYFINYHDKSPSFEYDNATGVGNFRYLENRKMLGVSTNWAVGNWAIGWEASYRPKDAIGLGGCYKAPQTSYNLVNGPFANVNLCPYTMDAKKVQTSVSAVLGLAPNEYPLLLKSVLHADNSQLSLEGVVVDYNVSAGTVRRGLGGVDVYQPVLAGGAYFLDSNGNLVSRANRYSGSVNIDFNWSYDGTVIPGWVVTPDVFYSYQKGDNPSAAAGALAGQQASTIGLFFTQNASSNVITAGLTYTAYFGGKTQNLVRQVYRDRNFVGAYANVTF